MALIASAAGLNSFAADDREQPRGLLGDMGGLRPSLARHGATLNLTEASELTRDVQGGLRKGQAYRGLTTATVVGLRTTITF